MRLSSTSLNGNHKSTCFEYGYSLNISGATNVNVLYGSLHFSSGPIILLKPKTTIFTFLVDVIKKFSGFKPLWAIRIEWM